MGCIPGKEYHRNDPDQRDEPQNRFPKNSIGMLRVVFLFLFHYKEEGDEGGNDNEKHEP